MTILRGKGTFQFTCDDCGDSLEFETNDFFEAKEALEEEGWKTRSHIDGGWCHFCSVACVTNFKQSEKDKDNETNFNSNGLNDGPDYLQPSGRRTKPKWPRKK